MFKLLLFLFISVPLLEIYLLLEVGSQIGVMNTIALILLTAIIGTVLLRQQGVSTLSRVQGSLDQGRLPATELLEGLMLLFSGALLLTPGFFTDGIGFICLVPVLRQAIANRILLKLLQQRQNNRNDQNPDIIEGEFWEDNSNNNQRLH